MIRKIIPPGHRNGKITVVAFHHQERRSSGTLCSYYECICDCGRTLFVRSDNLSGPRSSKQCKWHTRDKDVRHGLWGTAEYWVWAALNQRCYNPKNPAYKDYGGRGIGVFEAWRKDFVIFYAYVGSRPTPKHTLDRIDNGGNYEPGNVRWATRKEQQRNRRSNVLITFRDVTFCKAEWAEHLGITFNQLNHRLKSLPLEIALTACL